MSQSFLRPNLFTYCLTGFLLCFVISSCSDRTGENENVLAQIKDLKVTEAHLKSAYLKYYYQSGQTLMPSYSTKENILESEFNTYVLAVYAMDEGFANRSEAQQMQEMLKRKVLNEEYISQKVLDTVQVTDAETRSMFVKFNTVLRASHLYAPNRKKADSLHLALQNGASFEQLASEVFRNEALAAGGGDLGEFTVDEMDPAFERAAFALKKGEISEPVRTAQGYSIIKLTDKFTKPVLTEYQFASRKDQFAYFAEKQKMEILERSYMYEFTDNLSVNEDAFGRLWDKINTNYNAFLSGDAEWFNLNGEDELLAESGDYTFSVAEFLAEAMLTSRETRNGVTGESSLRRFIRGIAYRDYLYRQAVEAGIDEQSEVQASIDQSYYTYLAGVAEDHLRQQIEVSDAEMLRIYNEDPADFTKPLEINLSRIVVEDKEKAGKIVEELRAGASFTALVKEHTIDNEERLREGELGYDYIDNYGFLSPELSKLETGEISDPLFYQTGVYHIYKCLGRIDSRQLSFKEAREQVRRKVINEKLEALRNETIRTVRERHDATVNKEKLKNLTIQI